MPKIPHSVILPWTVWVIWFIPLLPCLENWILQWCPICSYFVVWFLAPPPPPLLFGKNQPTKKTVGLCFNYLSVRTAWNAWQCKDTKNTKEKTNKASNNWLKWHLHCGISKFERILKLAWFIGSMGAVLYQYRIAHFEERSLTKQSWQHLSWKGSKPCSDLRQSLNCALLISLKKGGTADSNYSIISMWCPLHIFSQVGSRYCSWVCKWPCLSYSAGYCLIYWQYVHSYLIRQTELLPRINLSATSPLCDIYLYWSSSITNMNLIKCMQPFYNRL